MYTYLAHRTRPFPPVNAVRARIAGVLPATLNVAAIPAIPETATRKRLPSRLQNDKS